MQFGVQDILTIWANGGWVMYPLALLSLLLYSTAIQTLLYLNRTNLGKVDVNLWRGWAQNPENAEGRVGEILRYVLVDNLSQKQIRNRFEEVRMSMLGMIERRTVFVSSLVATAPLMGLLGTVIGMLLTFAALSQGGGADTAGMVAEGIRKALITTQTGLTIALPGVFFVMIIRRKRHAIEAHISRLESMTLSQLKVD
ncbi:MAG: MotA/TolQ/ExbB proton channel family protein [Verrucomicrobiota bacterium]